LSILPQFNSNEETISVTDRSGQRSNSRERSSPPATGAEEKKLRSARVSAEFFYQKLLSDGWQEVSFAASALGAVGIVTLYHDQATKGFDEVSKTHPRGAPFGADITGEAVPDGIAGNQVRVQECFFDDAPRRTAEIDVTEVLGQRA
jgi:hypothetical protein